VADSYTGQVLAPLLEPGRGSGAGPTRPAPGRRTRATKAKAKGAGSVANGANGAKKAPRPKKAAGVKKPARANGTTRAVIPAPKATTGARA